MSDLALAPGSDTCPIFGTRAAWPLAVAFVGYPLWWALGFAPFVWIVAAIPMAARLLASRSTIRIPRGFGILLLFLAMVLLSGTRLETTNRMIGFGFRFAGLIATGVLFVFAYNLPRDALSVRAGLRILAAVWMATVAGGVIAVLLPTASLPSLAHVILPSSLTSNDFVGQLTTPVFAQVHQFLGFPLPRPAAPFTYTNTWGAMFALGLPFVFALALTARSARTRNCLFVILVIGAVPALVSVNRTMWAAVATVLPFLAVTVPSRRVRRSIRMLIYVTLVVLVLASMSWAGELVSQRLETPHSNAGRQDLIQAAGQSVIDAPVLGHGSPQTYEGPGIRPPVGTQGYLWFIAVSHGVPALLLFVSWWGLAFARARQGDPWIAPWFRAAVVAFAVMFPFYDLGDMPLNVMFLAAALSLRPAYR